MTDTIAYVCLLFSQTYVLLSIVIIGMLWGNRHTFYQLTVLSALSIMINVALKGTFKVPLPIELHPGYAFPSGHMQLSTVFYLWLLPTFKTHILRYACLLVLLGVGFGLMHFHYHTLSEILAGVFFGVCFLQGFYFASIRYWRCMPVALLIVCAFLLGYNLLIYSNIPKHFWSALYLLFFCVALERILCWTSNIPSLWTPQGTH